MAEVLSATSPHATLSVVWPITGCNQRVMFAVIRRRLTPIQSCGRAAIGAARGVPAPGPADPQAGADQVRLRVQGRQYLGIPVLRARRGYRRADGRIALAGPCRAHL